MKVGILTHYNVNNQGARLQMSALRHYLEDLGHEVVILTYEKNFDFDPGEAQKNSGSLKALPYYLKNYLLDKGPGVTVFNFRKVLAHRRSAGQYTYAPFDQSGCDVIVIGSDEVFSIDVGCNPMMYGHGLAPIPAIAYAPSFGRTTEADLQAFGCEDAVRSGLSELSSLSARDLHTQEMIRSLTGREAPLVCDPVLLYAGGALQVPLKPLRRPYMVIYSYDRHMTAPAEVAALRAYAGAHHLMTVSLGTYHSWCDRNIVCDAEHWYSYFRDAACVVTDTFHGTIAAIKNHCNTAVFFRPGINGFKLRSLLAELGLESRRLESLTAEELERVLSAPTDYAAVDTHLAEMARRSGNYLKNALERAYAQRH